MKLIIAAVIASTAVAFAAPAHADQTTYLNDLQNINIFSDRGDSALLTAGQSICMALAAGQPASQIAAELVYASDKRNGAEGISPKDADQIVIYAHYDLCPDASAGAGDQTVA